MYKSGDYEFEYVAMIGDVGISSAYDRIFTDLVRYAYPATYFDAGDDVFVGGTDIVAYYTPLLNNSGARPAPVLDLITKIEWLGNAQVQVYIRVGYETTSNYPPLTPASITGETIGIIDNSYLYTATGSDPEAEDIYYQWDWGNGELSDWLGPYASGAPCEASASWSEKNNYDVKVRTRDSWNFTSDWSEPLAVTMGCCSGMRGNFDGDPEDVVDVADLVFMVEFQFLDSGIPPACLEEADIAPVGALDSTVDIADLVSMVEYQFLGGAAPADCY